MLYVALNCHGALKVLGAVLVLRKPSWGLQFAPVLWRTHAGHVLAHFPAHLRRL